VKKFRQQGTEEKDGLEELRASLKRIVELTSKQTGIGPSSEDTSRNSGHANFQELDTGEVPRIP
jgi:hypothetical protein